MQPNPHLKNPHLEGGPFFWPAGPTGILLCHGYTATSAEVRQLAPLLYSHDYTVAGPLLPGHGTSPDDANRYRWQDWVAAIETTYQELKSHCQRIILGGESTGALLSLYLAARHPETIGILCYAPALKLKLSLYDQLRLRLLAPFITAVPKGNIDRDDLWQGYRVNPLKGALQLIYLQSQVRRLLPSVHQPILILQGRLDETVSPQAPQIIYNEIASEVKELHWMEHSSHCVILDKELDQVVKITLDFLHKILNSTKVSSQENLQEGSL